MSEGYIRLPEDDVGKYVRAMYNTISGNATYMEVLVLADSSGLLVDAAHPIYVQQSGQGTFLPATQVVKISGEYVEIVSGQVIQLPATQQIQISGQGTFLPATQVVKVSGETVSVASGSFAGPVALVSGFAGSVSLTDDAGANIVPVGVYSEAEANALVLSVQANLRGYDKDGVKWDFLRVNKSGQGALAVATSGSDYIISKISGEYVEIVSGQTVQLPATQQVQISGQGTFLPATQVVKVSGEYVEIVSGQVVQLPATQQVQVSGQGVFLPATQVVKISGEYVEIVSGQTVQLPATQQVQISGQGVFLPATQVVKISGDTIDVQVPTIIKTWGILVLNNNSGGVAIGSGATKSIAIKAMTHNSGIVYVGGSGDMRPYSGYGFALEAGEGRTYEVNDFGGIYAFSTISGYATITYDGVF